MLADCGGSTTVGSTIWPDTEATRSQRLRRPTDQQQQLISGLATWRHLEARKNNILVKFNNQLAKRMNELTSIYQT